MSDINVKIEETGTINMQMSESEPINIQIIEAEPINIVIFEATPTQIVTIFEPSESGKRITKLFMSKDRKVVIEFEND